MTGQRAWDLAQLGLMLSLTLAVGVLAVSSRAATPGAFTYTPAEATTAPADGQLKAYITGAVAKPGVYSVRAGDRVADLVELAGGPTEDAEVSAVNFARRVRDEDQVVVPRRGEPVVVSVGSAAGSLGGRLDINTATSRALETLPGIGPTRAQRIVESRAKDGPYASTADLVKRKLVPQSVYDSIKELIDVQP